MLKASSNKAIATMAWSLAASSSGDSNAASYSSIPNSYSLRTDEGEDSSISGSSWFLD